VPAAAAPAPAAETALEASLPRELERLDESHAAARGRRAAEMAADGRARAARYDAVDDDRVRALAVEVVRRVLEAGR
jgi:hypothetical protein